MELLLPRDDKGLNTTTLPQPTTDMQRPSKQETRRAPACK